MEYDRLHQYPHLILAKRRTRGYCGNRGEHMDSVSIAGTLMAMNGGVTKEALSTLMVKQTINQQNQIAGLIAQSAAPAPVRDSRYAFSTYA